MVDGGILEDVITYGGSGEAECGFCKRVHFARGCRTTLDGERIEELERRREKEPDKYIPTEDGGVLGARYLFWSNHHWDGAGGCSEYRTQAMERDAIRRLRLKYPGMIRRVERGGSGYSIELEFKVVR